MTDNIRLTFCTSIQEVDALEWNNLCQSDYPFIRHEFLLALEISGATTGDTGWLPYHLLAYQEQDGKPILVAAMPLFIKGHSYGEYVFDWSWADAYERHGLSYYPKLLNAIPFTPSVGPRCIGNNNYLPLLAQKCLKEVKKLNLSSVHWLFIDDFFVKKIHHNSTKINENKNDFRQPLKRRGCQFHWYNKDYQNFDDFLSHCNARKRKTLKKERQQVNQQGIRLQRILGENLTQQDWLIFYEFYKNTYLKRSGHEGYLSSDFFESIGRLMPNQIMMVKAEIEEPDTPIKCVAAALYFYSNTHLYGRYWGCNTEYDHLHFEACYYQGIEFAIEKKLFCFDAGAQGEHKIARGFKPTPTFSLHWLSHPEFHRAIKQFVEEEAEQVKEYEQAAHTRLPFKAQ